MREQPDFISFAPEKILPLRLSPFEEYLFLDQRRHFPMTGTLVLIFRGQIDRDLLAKAFDHVVTYEPFLFSVVRKKKGRLYWTMGPGPHKPVLICSETAASVLDMKSGSLTLDSFDLTVQSPVQFRLTTGPDGFIISFLVHHAISDGVGMLQFIERLFLLYKRMVDSAEEDLSVYAQDRLCKCSDSATADGAKTQSDDSICCPDPLALLEREDFHAVLPEKVSLGNMLRYVVTETFLWFCRRPLNLTPIFRRLNNNADNHLADSDDSKDTTNRKKKRSIGSLIFRNTNPPSLEPPRFFWKTIPSELAVAYRQKAKKYGVSVNSLFVFDIMNALAAWLKKTGKPSRFRRVRILIPANLRNSHHDRMPLANILGYAFLERFSQKCERSLEFLQEIDMQIKEIKKWSVGVFFIEGLRFFRRIPGALKLLTARCFCHSTLVFSNLGIIGNIMKSPVFRKAGSIFIEGQFELIGILGVPPVRPNTPLSIGVVSHNHEISITLCVDTEVVSQADREELFQAWVDQIRQTVTSDFSEAEIST